jgi:hypothetical protein
MLMQCTGTQAWTNTPAADWLPVLQHGSSMPCYPLQTSLPAHQFDAFVEAVHQVNNTGTNNFISAHQLLINSMQPAIRLLLPLQAASTYWYTIILQRSPTPTSAACTL